MQCPVCHNEVASESAAFCNHCGAPLSSATAGAAAPAPVPTAPPIASPAAPMNANLAAAVAYLTFIPAILFLMVEPYSKTPLVRFHSFQSIGLNVAALVVGVGLRLVPLPFGFGLWWFLQGLVNLLFFIVWLIVVLKAFQGEWFKLPIIGDFAMKQAQS